MFIQHIEKGHKLKKCSCWPWCGTTPHCWTHSLHTILFNYIYCVKEMCLCLLRHRMQILPWLTELARGKTGIWIQVCITEYLSLPTFPYTYTHTHTHTHPKDEKHWLTLKTLKTRDSHCSSIHYLCLLGQVNLFPDDVF